MAKKKADPEVAELQDDQELVRVSERLGNAIEVSERLGDKAESAVISSYNPETKEQEYLASIPIETYSLDYVRDQYGGGKYIVLFLNDNGKIVSRTMFTIAKTKGAAGPASPPSGSPSAPAVPGMSPEMAILLGQFQGLKTLVEVQGVMMGKAFDALAGSGGKKDAKDPLDVGLEIARIIKENSTPPSGDRVSIKDLAETFREGIQFGQLVNTPPSSDGFGEVIKTFGAPVAKAIESAIETDRAAKAPALAPPAAPPQVAPPKPEAPMIDLAKAPWLAHLRPFMPEIQAWATHGWDPDAFVPSMVARMPEHIQDEIEAASKDPKFIETALAALPTPFQAYRAWFTRALEVLKEEVTSDEAPPTGPVLHEEDDDEEPGTGQSQ